MLTKLVTLKDEELYPTRTVEKNTHGKNVNEHTGMNDEISYTDIAFWLLELAPLASEERDRFYRP